MGHHAGEAHTEPHEEPKSLCKRFLKFLFGHVGLFLLVSMVAALGAQVFIELERSEEDRRYLLKRNKARDIMDATQYISLDLWHYSITKNLTFAKWDKKVQSNLKLLEENVIEAVNEYNYDGTEEGWNQEWSFSKALLFTISIMTTIGYGHIAPRTIVGQIFVIVYGLIATPLLLVFLARIGDGMSHLFRYTYSRICCRWCRSTRYKSEAGLGKRVKRLSDDVVGREEYMPTDEVHVPIIVNSMVILWFLLLGGVLFSAWENWNIISACYFSFVTVSTIGFGDMVPGNSFGTDGQMAAFRMGMTIAYCILGLALISMSIQMMQDQILAKVRWTAQEMGIIESEESARRVVQYRKSKPGQVMETAEYRSAGELSEAEAAEKRRQRRRERRAEKQRKRGEHGEKDAEEKAKLTQEDEGNKKPEKEEPKKEENKAVAPVDDFDAEDLFNLA